MARLRYTGNSSLSETYQSETDVYIYEITFSIDEAVYDNDVFVVKIISEAGAAYDREVLKQNFKNIMEMREAITDNPIRLRKNDTLSLEWTNVKSRTYAAEVYFRV